MKKSVLFLLVILVVAAVSCDKKTTPTESPKDTVNMTVDTVKASPDTVIQK